MLVDGETPAAALIYRFIEYLTETEGYLDFIRWLNEWQVFTAYPKVYQRVHPRVMGLGCP